MNLIVHNFAHFRLTDAGRTGVLNSTQYTLYDREADEVYTLTADQYAYIAAAENEADLVASARETIAEILDTKANLAITADTASL